MYNFFLEFPALLNFHRFFVANNNAIVYNTYMDARKLKIYLDTSVISYLFAEEAPEKMDETKKLWRDIVSNKYDVYLSDTTLREVMNCAEPKRSAMVEKLKEIDYTHLETNNEVKLTNI